MKVLRKALQDHTQLLLHPPQAKSSTGDDYLNQLTQKGPPPPPVEKYFAYPQFFLDSLVYHSPTDWVIQINRYKITQMGRVNLGKDKLTIIQVDPDSVMIEWKPDDMDKVMDVWNRLGAHDDPLVHVDPRAQSVIFRLHANETFSSYAMRVLEGKVRQMVVEVTIPGAAAPNVPPQKGNAPPPVPLPPKAAPAAPAGDSDHQGLRGLINDYQQLQ